MRFAFLLFTGAFFVHFVAGVNFVYVLALAFLEMLGVYAEGLSIHVKYSFELT